MTLNKYMVGLLQVVLISVTALQAALADGVTATEAWQLAALIVGAVVSVFVPLLEKGWAGALKVGGAVLGALLAAIVPFATGGWSAEALVIVALAGLNALATQLGVSIRVDSAKEKVAAQPEYTVSEPRPIDVVDPAAVVIAQHQGAGVG